MHRILPLVGLLGVLPACEGEDTRATGAPARFEVVAAPEVTDQQVDAFCDTRYPADKGLPYSWPATDSPPPADSSGWTWVSLWATWCGPCIAEMPMLAEWTAKLAGDGVPVVVHYLSVDATPDELGRWRMQHKDAPEILRMSDPAKVQDWLEGMGVEGVGSIPIHLWIDPADRIRCVRSGGIGTSDYGIVRKMLRDG